RPGGQRAFPPVLQHTQPVADPPGCAAAGGGDPPGAGRTGESEIEQECIMNWVRLMGVLAISAGIWGITGCGSGSKTDVNSGSPQVAPPQALQSATLSRLLVNGDGTQTSVKGTLSIKD